MRRHKEKTLSKIIAYKGVFFYCFYLTTVSHYDIVRCTMYRTTMYRAEIY